MSQAWYASTPVDFALHPRCSKGTNSATTESRFTPKVFQRNLEPRRRSGPPPSMTTFSEFGYQVGQSCARTSHDHTASAETGMSSSLRTWTAVSLGPCPSDQLIDCAPPLD